MPVAWAISLISPPMRSTLSRSEHGEGGEFLVDLRRALKPAIDVLGAHIAVENALRGTRWRSARRSIWPPKREPTVVGVKLIDDIFDLAA
jgi:hypothetical protein